MIVDKELKIIRSLIVKRQSKVEEKLRRQKSGHSHSLRGQNGVMGKMKGACPEDESLSEILKTTWECNLKEEI